MAHNSCFAQRTVCHSRPKEKFCKATPCVSWVKLMRWMLITLDRTFQPTIEMTHQEISERLGFRREAITLALGKLTERGHIHIRRGTIEVICREALEAQVCDCYWIGQEKIKPDFSQNPLVHRALGHGWRTAMQG